MNLFITVDGHTTCLNVPDEETIVMVQRDYQKRLAEAKNPSKVQPRTPQQIMNSLYGKEEYCKKRLHEHWARPTSNDNEETGPDDYDSFAIARQNQGSGLSYRNLENLSTSSAEDLCVEAMVEDEQKRLLTENLKPEQVELATEVILEGKKQVEYAAEKHVTKQAVSGQMNTIKKKLEKILKKP